MVPENVLGKVIAAIVAIITLAVVAVTLIIMTGKDPSILIAFIGVLVSGTIPSLFAILRIENMGKDVNEVKDKVNGQMSKLVDKIPNSNGS